MAVWLSNYYYYYNDSCRVLDKMLLLMTARGAVQFATQIWRF